MNSIGTIGSEGVEVELQEQGFEHLLGLFDYLLDHVLVLGVGIILVIGLPATKLP